MAYTSIRTILLASLLAASLLAGCASDTDPGADDAALDGPETPDVAEPIVLFQDTFTGMLPAPEPGEAAVSHTHTVPVPAGATALTVDYETTYTGLWYSYVTILDPAGEEAANILDGCGFGGPAPGAMESYSCSFGLKRDLAAGDWTIQVAWQLGEVAEEYSILATVTGPAADAAADAGPETDA